MRIDSNRIILIIGIVVILYLIYHFTKENNSPIPNDGSLSAIQLELNNRNDYSSELVNEVVSQYTMNNRDSEGTGSFGASDPMESDYGAFAGNVNKEQIDMSRMEEPMRTEFTHKKKKFVKRTPEEVEDLFDVDKMLPQEERDDWFDTEPLQTTKKIKGNQFLVHPKYNIGVNTVGTSLRNGSHDLRGDIPNPKINIGPWMNSTIEPDTNIKGLCGSNW